MEDITLTERISDELARISPDTTIYTENQPNGFEEPCFFINRAGSTVSRPQSVEKQERTYGYQVVYFAPEDNANAELERMEELLLDNFIALTDYAYLRNREAQIDTNERTLSFQFDLILMMHKVDNTPKQKELGLNARAKDNN